VGKKVRESVGTWEKENDMWGLEELHACLTFGALFVSGIHDPYAMYRVSIKDVRHKMRRFLAWEDATGVLFLFVVPQTLFGDTTGDALSSFTSRQIASPTDICSNIMCGYINICEGLLLLFHWYVSQCGTGRIKLFAIISN
jgi:hypothetical protein